MPGANRILIADGDPYLGKLLKRELIATQSHVNVYPDGRAACRELLSTEYDLVILDLNLPGMDGMDLLKEVRQNRVHLPILILTARSHKQDMIRGLDHGADDFMSKPFSLRELHARVRCLLRRKHNQPQVSSRLSDLTIDLEGHLAYRGKRRIELTPREFEILQFLVDNTGKVVSRKTLMEEVWKSAFDPATNIVDVYMKYLRDKIDLEGETKLIHTIRGVGYVLRQEHDVQPGLAGMPSHIAPARAVITNDARFVA